MRIRRRRIEHLVAELLTKHNVTAPPIPVEAIAQKEGLQIRLEPLQSNLSGFLYRHQNQAILGANSLQARVRQRFTIAHELGHFLLHDHEQLHIDRSPYFRLRSELASQGVDPTEIEANSFAAALLMPGSMVSSDLAAMVTSDVLDDDSLAKLSRKYGVSTQAMVLRLTNLGYVEQ